MLDIIGVEEAPNPLGQSGEEDAGFRMSRTTSSLVNGKNARSSHELPLSFDQFTSFEQKSSDSGPNSKEQTRTRHDWPGADRIFKKEHQERDGAAEDSELTIAKHEAGQVPKQLELSPSFEEVSHTGNNASEEV